MRRQSPLSQSASVDDQADPKHAIFFHQERRPATPLWAVLLAKSLVSSGCCLCSASFDGGTASSLEAPIDSTLPRIPRRRGFHDVVQCFLSRLFSHLPTSLPNLPLQSNETRWPLSSPCTDTERAGSRWDSKHARRVRSWSSSQRGSSASALSEFLFPLDYSPFYLTSFSPSY